MNKEKQLPAIVYPNIFEVSHITLRSKHDLPEEIIANIFNPLINFHCPYKYSPYSDCITGGLKERKRDLELPPIHSSDPIRMEPFKPIDGKIKIKGDQ